MNYGRRSTEKKSKLITSRAIRIKNKTLITVAQLLVIVILSFIILGICLGLGAYKGILASAPDINSIDPTPTGYSTTIYDDSQQQIGTLVSSGANRKYATIDTIPMDMQHAFVAIEDSRFYEHNGVDVKGIIRAGVVGLTSGNFSEGASTITQQLLKNNVFTDWTDETNFIQKLKRKIQEQYLAVKLEEKIQDKNFILETYMNSINLGQNTLGVQAASLRYFGKDVTDLTLSESTVIAGITQNPSAYNPISHPEANQKRRKKVLDNMLDQGYITQGAYDEAIEDDVYSRIQEINTIVEDTSTITSYFQDELVEQVVDDLISIKGYSESQAYKLLYSGGLSINSTQSSKIQAICEKEISNEDNYRVIEYSFTWQIDITNKDGSKSHYTEQTLLNYNKENISSKYTLDFNTKEDIDAAIDQYKETLLADGGEVVSNSEYINYTLQPQASVSIIDPTTGEVKGIAGGRGTKQGSRTLNRATNTYRQPGSTFKVLAAFAPAIDSAGMTLATVQDNAPYKYASGQACRNYDNTYTGFTTIRDAIIHSINVVAVKTGKEVTPQLEYDYLLNFGFTSIVPQDMVESLPLGGITNGVSNLELNAAYATIANQGTYTKPRFYTTIYDHDGNLLLDNTPQTHTVLEPTSAWLLTDAMRDVISVGSGSAAKFSGMDMAGKTGTTQNYKDSLFAGYTPYYSCVVWEGYDDGSELKHITAARSLWKSIMSQIHDGLEYKTFTKPAGIVTAKICTKSGKLAIDGVCDADPRGDMTRTEYFVNGTQPTEVCDHHVALDICTISNALATQYCPPETVEKKIFIVGGSKDSEDGPYLLPEDMNENICTIHTALTQEIETPDPVPEEEEPIPPVDGPVIPD